MGSALGIQGVTKRYGHGAAAVDDVSLEVAAGEFVSLLGASGSGKTTTLMMVAGFTPPDGGTILLGGAPITHLPPERRGIGVVFQHYALFPHMDVVRNVAFPLRMRGLDRRRARERALGALGRVGLDGLDGRLPSQLSGGQQQRVALARALVFEPGLLLMDEPLGALDRSLRETMKGEIRRLHRELGITILYVTHDQEEALTLSDRVALMDRGRIVQIGRASDLYEKPVDAFVAGFIGESTLIPGRVVTDADGAALRPDGGGPPLPARSGALPADASAILLLRPEKVLLRPEAAEGFAGIVDDAVYIGDVTRWRVTLAGGPSLQVKQANRGDVFRPAVGQAVRVGWSRDDAVLLPAARQA